MERRMLLAVVLSFIAVTAYSAMTGSGCMRRPPPPEEGTVDAGAADGGEATDAGESDAGEADAGTVDGTVDGSDDGDTSADGGTDDGGAEDPQPEDGAKPPKRAAHPHDGVDEERVTLQSPELEATFTSRGGGVHSVLQRRVKGDNNQTPMALVTPSHPDLLLGGTDLSNWRPGPQDAPGDPSRVDPRPGPMRRLNWKRDQAAEDATEEDDVVFRFETRDGLVVYKRWSLAQEEGRFDLRLRMWARRTSGEGDDRVPVMMLASSGMLRELFRGVFGNPNEPQFMRNVDGSMQGGGQTPGLPLVELQRRGVTPESLDLLGTRSTYFLTTYYRNPENEADIASFWVTGEADRVRNPKGKVEGGGRGRMEEQIEAFFVEDLDRNPKTEPSLGKRIKEGVDQMLHAWMVVDVPVAAAGATQATFAEFSFYTGPIDRQVLGQEAYDTLHPVVTYPNAWDPLAKLLLWIYDLWRGIFGSAGLAVIFMTLTVRGALMPISIRNQLSMRRYGRKVSKLKPKLAVLQEKYGKNPKRMREEQMKLYKEHGVGFPSGCIMMLIQIPIFFALFSALRVEYSLRGESFLWIKDLAGPDQLIVFGSTLLDLGVFRLDALNVLPLLMVVLSIYHTKSMPKPADEQQAQQMKMMKWLPIFFAFILYNYTAALALYMVMSSAFAIVESRIVRAKDEADQAAEAAPATA